MDPKTADFKTIDRFPGYNSAADKTKLPAGTLIRGSKNVLKNLRGNIENRPGIKRRGAADSTEAGTKSSTEWSTSVGTFRVLRINNGKLEVESDIVTSGTYLWYELFDTGTLASLAGTYTRFVFDTWWDDVEKKDRLVMVRGDDQIRSWSGGMALISSTTATTITLQGTSTWAQMGFHTNLSAEKKIMVNGKEVTYTGGETTTTLTGCTISSGAVTDLTSGMVAIQSIIIYDNEPIDGFEADFIKTIGNQLWVGSYSSRLIYISADYVGNALFDFENAGAHVPGDPDRITMDNLGKGIGEEDGKVILFAGSNDLYVVSPNTPVSVAYSDIGDSGDRFVYMKVEKKQLPGLQSALGHEFIGNIPGAIIWMDQKNQMRGLSTFTNETVQKPVHISLPVQDELEDDDLTGGHLRVIGDTVHVTAPNNARDWMYQIREKLNDDGTVSTERIWQPPQIRGIQRFAVIAGETYGHSNVNPAIYQIWNTEQWFDNTASTENIPYISVARFAYQSHDRPEGLVIVRHAYSEGYMPKGNPLKLSLYLDYQGSVGTREMDVSSNILPARTFEGADAPALGDSGLGDNPLGDGIIEESNNFNLLPKFRASNEVPNAKNCFEYSLEFYSLKVDSRWELLRIGTDAKLANENATFIKK